MSELPYWLEPLGKHNRTSFDCGVRELNSYLRTQVGQDIKRRYSKCFVAVEKSTGEIGGYYTLAMSSVPLSGLPDELGKKLPRYPQVPVARIGRLAVDQRHQGQQLGAVLLANAIARTAQADVGAYAIVVDAKDEHAAKFYEHFGFRRLPSDPRSLVLPISAALKKISE